MKTTEGSVLVIGSGIGGIRSALDLAELGHQVILIDKSPQLGGTLSRLDYQFPSDHCGMCKMLPMIDRDASSQYCLRRGLFHENIEVMLSTELADLKGEPGRFEAVLRYDPPLVDAQRCTGCGECARVCPAEAPDAFNAGLTRRKAIYLPVPHTIPNHYVVDTAACVRCGECERACPTGAIHLGLDERKSFQVLVVDDERIVRESTREWLIEEGFEADMAGSGSEAVEMLSSHDYGLMLLDVKMPGMDGLEVLKRAKAMRPDLEVVMMTAYATVETAVEAMKFGARDYIMKPFDPEALVNQVLDLYRSRKPAPERTVQIGAVLIATGFGLADPREGLNPYGYGELPGVVTGIEFERLMSGTGPTRGRLLRPGDGKEVRKVAWLQCAGSRTMAENTDFCSSICCMFSIKEALLAKERSLGTVDTAIFYMDMRTFGKGYQRYRDKAEKEHGVRFVRSRVHTVEPDRSRDALRITYADAAGALREEFFDLVVLATGQRPPEGLKDLAEKTGIELNNWGFCRVGDLSACRTSREGIYAAGAASGAKDIGDSLIHASSASVTASALVHGRGGAGAEEQSRPTFREVSRERPQCAVALCTCGGAIEQVLDWEKLVDELKRHPSVSSVFTLERACTKDGWTELVQRLQESRANRVLIAGCLPQYYGGMLKDLGRAVGLHPSLMDMVDIRTPLFPLEISGRHQGTKTVRTLLDMGVARLTEADPRPRSSTQITQKALVVGGGIAGMTAALSIADHGFEVSLIERNAELGGKLRRLYRTLRGSSPQELLEKTRGRVLNHPKIKVYASARVLRSKGQVGGFVTSIAREDGSSEVIDHGVAILATGAREARTESYGYGLSEAVMTQHELEEKLHGGDLSPSSLGAVAMIQCVDSREGNRPYCSRLCCASALKNALALKGSNPDVEVYILYRDLMSYGFLETYFTQARRAGVVFIPYTPDRKPVVAVDDDQVTLAVFDSILGRELRLRPDVLALSTGIVPEGQEALATIFGVDTDEDGFFQEAEPKWRPVDAMKDGVFLCGMAHSPRLLDESVAMAEAAAQRALRILSHERVESASVVAEVRPSLCALCERCIAACPYGARWKDEAEERIVVNEISCQGCGSCAAVCPNGASVMRGYADRQVLATLDAACRDIP